MTVLLTPCSNGQWVSHFLEMDIISQGNSAEHALSMVKEATLLCLDDDRYVGDSLPKRPRAPSKYWALVDHPKGGVRVMRETVTIEE